MCKGLGEKRSREMAEASNVADELEKKSYHISISRMTPQKDAN